MQATDHRIERPGICGATKVGCTGIEWVCIRPVHGKVYTRRSSSRTHRRGDLIFDQRSADFHYMVPRYPMRQAAQ